MFEFFPLVYCGQKLGLYQFLIVALFNFQDFSLIVLSLVILWAEFGIVSVSDRCPLQFSFSGF